MKKLVILLLVFFINSLQFLAQSNVHNYSERIDATFTPDCDSSLYKISSLIYASTLPNDPSNVTVCPGNVYPSCMTPDMVEWQLFKNGTYVRSQYSVAIYLNGKRWANTFRVTSSGTYMVYMQFAYVVYSGFLGLHADYYVHNHYTDSFTINDPTQFCCTQNKNIAYTVSGVDNHEAVNNITAVNTINNTANVKYHAGNQVLLDVGFSAAYGSAFHAYIQGCSGTFYRLGQFTANDESAFPATLNSLTQDGSPEGKLIIFPNPNGGLFTIKSNTGNEKDVRIYDVLGNLVSEKLNTREQNIPVDISDQKKGIYFVKITEENNVTKVQKVINQ